jgi:hypothetical protein
MYVILEERFPRKLEHAQPEEATSHADPVPA